MPIVKMLITNELMSEVFRLKDVGSIVGASLQGDDHATWLELEVYTRKAPEGATEMHPWYERTMGVPDPVRITGITWTHADGTEEHRPWPSVEVSA